MKDSKRISSRTEPSDARPASEGSSSSTAERFSLSGPSIALDPSIHAYRSDVADIALAGQLIAPHYARPVIRRAAEGAILLERRDGDSHIADLTAGEEFAVLDITGGWAWGYRRADHKVGYVRADALTA